MRKWTNRLLLTSLPIISWTFVEARLYQLFALFPADLQGIMQAVRFMEAGNTEEDLPSTLKDWEAQLQKSRIEANVIRRWRTLAHHEAYLKDHPEVWRWLKALVVYPYPTWNVTIAIGKALGLPVTYDNLMLLARIPWLQEGNLKTQLWQSFWSVLSSEDEKIARAAVKTELETVRQQTANAFAGQQLELQLAIQNFALKPTNPENRAAIQFLKNENLLPKLHLEELDKVVERHIPKHRTGQETGQTLQHYLIDADKEAAEKLPKPFFTKYFWWAAALSLLTLLGGLASLLQKGIHRQHIEIEKSEAARLNNIAVQYMAFNTPINLDQLANINEDSFSIRGFNYKSTAALNLLNKAIQLEPTFKKAHHNFQKQWYNDGISHYHQYLNDKSYNLRPAKDFLKNQLSIKVSNQIL